MDSIQESVERLQKIRENSCTSLGREKREYEKILISLKGKIEIDFHGFSIIKFLNMCQYENHLRYGEMCSALFQETGKRNEVLFGRLVRT